MTLTIVLSLVILILSLVILNREIRETEKSPKTQEPSVSLIPAPLPSVKTPLLVEPSRVRRNLSRLHKTRGPGGRFMKKTANGRPIRPLK
jgi:hypothetical protein